MAQPKVFVEMMEEKRPVQLRVVVDNQTKVANQEQLSAYEMECLILEELDKVAVLSEN
ncbi:MAG: hypothetical protein OQK12_08710 [Motiliproteus sp.]|nr:hypothetical protein [Motiliproteus sp.]MCW9052788.1 hypothetical protein [Motiliproteus sp.]